MNFHRYKDKKLSLCQKCFDDPEVKKTHNDVKINPDDYKAHELGQRESISCDGLRYDDRSRDGYRCGERHSVDTCDGCKYFDNNGKKQGACRLNPPVFNANTDRFVLPTVKWTDWCSRQAPPYKQQ